MEYRAHMLRRISEVQAFWAIVVAIIVIDVAWSLSAGIRIVPDPVALAGIAFIAAINLVYATVRPHVRIAAAAASVLQLAAFTSVGAVLSYLTVTSRYPLIDRHLAAVDTALGVDWVAMFHWVHDHPVILRVFAFAYNSMMLQVGVLLVVLNALGRLDRVREFVWLFVLSLLIIIPISWLLPAEGAWAYYGVSHLTNAYYLPDFFALREGRMPEIVMSKVTGVIQFPSFHAALGLILIYAYRGIRYLFPISCLLNICMIASTAPSGGHHIADILAGLAAVPLAVVIFRLGQSERAAAAGFAGSLVPGAQD
jgi:hypothetical protein